MGKPDDPPSGEAPIDCIAGWRTLPAPPPVPASPVELLPAVDELDDDDTSVDERPLATREEHLPR